MSATYGGFEAHYPGQGSPALTGARTAGLGARRAHSWFNVWILLICLLGTAIVIGDGLTREANFDWEFSSQEPLQYEPYAAAAIFALTVLPLTLLYAAQVGVEVAEGLFLWFLLCTVVYTKDFAYLHVPGLPLYVTDLMLGFLVVVLLKRYKLRWLRLRPALTKLLIAFVTVGAVSFLVSLRAGRDPLFVARDFALVVYSLFLLVALYLVCTWAAVRRVLLFSLIGAVLASLNALAWFLVQPGQRRYIFYGTYVLVAFLGVMVATVARLLRPRVGWPLAIVLAVGVLLYNSRAVYVALGFSLLILLAWGVSLQKRRRLLRAKVVIGVPLVVCLAFLLIAQTDAGWAFLQRTADELVSGTLHYLDDPNVQFRLLAWAEAIGRFLESPWVGEGFGVPFAFGAFDTDPRPHNTYLTVLYKMGVVGFVPFVLVLGLFFLSAWRMLQRYRGSRASVLLYIVVLGQVMTCIIGLSGLLLESPFLASLFWATMGVGFRLMKLMETPRLPPLTNP